MSSGTYEPFYYKLTREEERWDTFPGREVISFICKKLEKGGQMLDLGCGTAGILEYLPGNIYYTGIDSSAYAIKEAKEKFRTRSRTNFLQQKKATLPFADRTFDMVLLFFSLEHILNPVETLIECRRVLKGGGYLVLAAPNLEFPLAWPNALRHKPLIYRLWFTALRSKDYCWRIFGRFAFRILAENYTSATGRYERKDDDLWHLVSAFEVIKFLENQGYRLDKFWQEKPLTGWRKMLRLFPTLRWYGVPLAAALKKL